MPYIAVETTKHGFVVVPPAEVLNQTSEEQPYSEGDIFIDSLEEADQVKATNPEAIQVYQVFAVCPECGEPREDDDRVEGGMKCGPCNYGGG